MRKALQTEQGKADMEARIQQLESERKELERQVAEWKAKCEVGTSDSRTRRATSLHHTSSSSYSSSYSSSFSFSSFSPQWSSFARYSLNTDRRWSVRLTRWMGLINAHRVSAFGRDER